MENQASLLNDPNAPLVILTTGPSYEPIDAVRRITNFSSGATGTLLSAMFLDAGWKVILFRGATSIAAAPGSRAGLRIRPFSTLASLEQSLRDLAAELQKPPTAVLHAAALSDFLPAQIAADSLNERQADRFEIGSGKLESRAGPVTLQLQPAPKLLPRLREWFPSACIAGWKYEIQGGLHEAMEAARRQLARDGIDVSILNGPAYGEGYLLFKKHATNEPEHIETLPALGHRLLQICKEGLKA